MFTDTFSFTLKTEGAESSDTLLSSYLSPRLHMREDSNLSKIFVLLHIVSIMFQSIQLVLTEIYLNRKLMFFMSPNLYLAIILKL
jgi:hypothetical protein